MKPMDATRRFVPAAAIIGIALFFFNLGGRDLWEPDETRYAVIAREMKETGNWILPHLNGEVYAEKPPLFFWLVNGSTFLLGRNNEFANRLPSALAGFITFLLVFSFGERLFGSRAGFFSSLVLATCFLFPQLSRWMMMDSLVTLFFLLATFYFYLGYEEEGSRRKYDLLAGFFMGLGVLTKGPIGYLPLPTILLFALFQKNMKRFWNRNLLWSCLLSLVLVLIWWLPAAWMGGKDYIYWLLFKQAVGTYIEGGTHFHPQPFYFYFLRFPLEFLPWAVFLPAAFIFGLRKEFGKRKEFLFLSIWFVFIFLFFTLSKGKKDNYLFPLYPAAALMVGGVWNLWLPSKEGRKGFLPGLLLLASVLLVGLILSLVGALHGIYPELKDYHWQVVSILSYLFAGGLLSLLFFVREKRWAAFISLMVVFALFHLQIFYLLPPRLNPQRSAKAFSAKILERMESGDDLKTYRLKSNGLLYYTGMPYIESIQNKDRLVELFNASKRVFVVAYPEVVDLLRRETGMRLFPVEQGRVGHWEYVVVSNR
jgi:4-amino-4-deoxy-L-arabinose transferase-like glycosyltransferase